MSMVERDPERGRAAAARLKALGVRESSSRQPSRGYITQLACKMPECFCPEELGGACYFEPVTDELSDWMPTHEHFPRSKREGGHRDGDNAVLAHRLCNRIDTRSVLAVRTRGISAGSGKLARKRPAGTKRRGSVELLHEHGYFQRVLCLLASPSECDRLAAACWDAGRSLSGRGSPCESPFSS